MSNKQFSNIATNIISGFLGAGKTTAIKYLLKQKPESERWAVIVNEFGQIGIDGNLLANDQVKIKQIPGGCLCCVGSQSLNVGLNEIIRSIKPHRIIIEPTGLGHPEKLIKALTGEFYKTVLALKAVINLVDARQLNVARYTDNETFQAQIQFADILIANKCDTYSKDDKQRFSDFIKTFHSEKIKTEMVEQGELKLEWLDYNHKQLNLPELDTSHNQHIHQHAPELTTENTNWVFSVADADGFTSASWVIKEHVFKAEPLKKWVDEITADTSIERIKAVIQTNIGWLSFNCSRHESQVLDSKSTSFSKLEIISSKTIMAAQLDNQLKNLIQ